MFSVLMLSCVSMTETRDADELKEEGIGRQKTGIAEQCKGGTQARRRGERKRRREQEANPKCVKLEAKKGPNASVRASRAAGLPARPG